jgi:hypothetical protein
LRQWGGRADPGCGRARKAQKLAAAPAKKARTDWSEAGRKAYRTKLQNAAARGDNVAAAKLVKLAR